jgi:outer membrane protein OmpA-like peptidoglycan-associated protein
MRSFLRTHMAALSSAVALGIAPMVASAQSVERSTAIASSEVLSQISMFNYRAGRKADLILRATPIIATGEGRVEVEYDDGNAEISAEVKRLPEPTSLGPYTSYVLWALTPDGRFSNEGVLTDFEGGKGSLETQHGASQFALIVTAEPHFAVSVPSTMIVLYNVAENVKGQESKVTSLSERADYSDLTQIAIDDRARPVELVQAEYAVAIARAAGAEQYASRLYTIAQEKLVAARTALTSRRSSERKRTPDLAREAVISGEDARRAAMVARSGADAERLREEAAAAAAAAERERAAVAAAEAARRAEAAAQEAARVAAAAAEAKAIEAARADLLNRLNFVLPTRESERGLVSEIGGVQFATGTARLNAQARETLAKFSGIVASYPSLTFVIEGHTDSTGSDATNRELSWQRAISVRDYLIAQGVAASSIDVKGLGSTRPVADNATASGRARNRRVEIVIAGELLASR